MVPQYIPSYIPSSISRMVLLYIPSSISRSVYPDGTPVYPVQYIPYGTPVYPVQYIPMVLLYIPSYISRWTHSARPPPPHKMILGPSGRFGQPTRRAGRDSRSGGGLTLLIAKGTHLGQNGRLYVRGAKPLVSFTQPTRRPVRHTLCQASPASLIDPGAFW